MKVPLPSNANEDMRILIQSTYLGIIEVGRVRPPLNKAGWRSLISMCKSLGPSSTIVVFFYLMLEVFFWKHVIIFIHLFNS